MKASNQVFENNTVIGTVAACECPLPGRCSPIQQEGPGCHPLTARVKWNREVNNVVIECFDRSKLFD